MLSIVTSVSEREYDDLDPVRDVVLDGARRDIDARVQYLDPYAVIPDIARDGCAPRDIWCTTLIPTLLLSYTVHLSSVSFGPVRDLYPVRAGADLHVSEDAPRSTPELPVQVYSIPQAGAGAAGIAAESYLLPRGFLRRRLRPYASNPPPPPSNTIVTPGSIVSVAARGYRQQVDVLDYVDRSGVCDRRGGGGRHRARESGADGYVLRLRNCFYFIGYGHTDRHDPRGVGRLPLHARSYPDAGVKVPDVAVHRNVSGSPSSSMR